MDIMTKVFDEIKFRIPNEILKEAFKDTVQNWRKAPISLDEQMRLKVIKPRVLIDANLVGGQSVVLYLNDVAPEIIDDFTAVFHIPAEKVNNRSIMTVLSVNYTPYARLGTFSGRAAAVGTVLNTSDISHSAMRVMDSHSSVPYVSNANVELVGDNIVLIRDRIRISNWYSLRCMIANDDNLSNISPRNYLDFVRLCELAIKSYIYNTLFVRMDRAKLEIGQELGSFKSYVDNLADSEEMYQTFLNEVWRKVSIMNDEDTYDRFIKLQINPAL